MFDIENQSTRELIGNQISINSLSLIDTLSASMLHQSWKGNALVQAMVSVSVM